VFEPSSRNRWPLGLVNGTYKASSASLVPSSDRLRPKNKGSRTRPANSGTKLSKIRKTKKRLSGGRRKYNGSERATQKYRNLSGKRSLGFKMRLKNVLPKSLHSETRWLRIVRS